MEMTGDHSTAQSRYGLIDQHKIAIKHLLDPVLGGESGSQDSASSISHTLDDSESSSSHPSPMEAPANSIVEPREQEEKVSIDKIEQMEEPQGKEETGNLDKISQAVLDVVTPTQEKLSHVLEPVLESELWTSTLEAIGEGKKSMQESVREALSSSTSNMYTRLSKPLREMSEDLTLFGVVELVVWAMLVLFLVRRTWTSSKKGRGNARDMVRALQRCKTDLRAEMVRMECSPLMLRLAWSDCATHDKNAKFWPECGGAVGAVRFQAELRHENNKGLFKAIKLLEAVKSRHEDVSWADLIQMAGVLAVETTGGPRIRIRYGRMDAPNFHESRNTLSYPVQQVRGEKGGIRGTAQAAKAKGGKGVYAGNLHHSGGHGNGLAGGSDGCPFIAQLARRLPQAIGPYPDGAAVPSVHIRNVFYRMGFDNREIVALCGAHTIGRAFSDRSGVTEHSSGYKGATPYTCATSSTAHDGDTDQTKSGVGMPGGCSWTRNWLTFDNSYYRNAFIGDEKKAYMSLVVSNKNSTDEQAHNSHLFSAISNPMRRTVDPNARNPVRLKEQLRLRDPQLLWLPTDNALETDPEFKSFFFIYAQDQQKWYRDYAAAHKKMSELGAKWSNGPTEAVYIE